MPASPIPHQVFEPIAVLAMCMLGACASIRPEFDAAREAALADPDPLEADWRPDAVIRLSAPLVDDLVSAVIRDHGTLTAELSAGPLTVTPRLKIDALEVRGGRDCDDCLAMDAELSGSVSWSSPMGEGKRSLSASASLDAVFTATADELGAWTLSARPSRVRDISLEVGGSVAALSSLDRAVRPWIDTALSAVPATPIASVGTLEIPVRGVRVVPDRRTVQLQVRTIAPGEAVVPTDGPRPRDGFWVDLAPESAMGLARRAAFAAGPVAYDVTPEPTSLVVDDDRFELGLRLWRTTGRGWWRDLAVEGGLAVQRGALALTPEDAVEVAQSRGAVWVDPIAALVEGVLLTAVSDALDTTLPVRRAEQVVGVETVLKLQTVHGVDGVLRAEGTLRVRGETRGRGGEDATVRPKGTDQRSSPR